MATKVDPGPDPSPKCDRCNYFTYKQPELTNRRAAWHPYPPLDQKAIDELLPKAFPKSYGLRG